MSLPNSPLNQEFAAIQKSPNVDAPLIYKAIIHIPNKNLNYTCLKVLSIDIDRDYENKLSDDIVAGDLDIDANELELIYRARGMDEEAAHHRALERFGYLDCDCDPSLSHRANEEGMKH